MLKAVFVFLVIVGFIGVMSLNFSSAAASGVGTSNQDDDVSRVICNVIQFVQKLGLPIMTGVILGSSIMAIFGRLPWPAIVMLVVFTAIFFGAGKLVSKFVNGINNSMTSGTDCTTTPSASSK
ncbi:trbC/VIRB2 family protein [Ehrlichia chaffeensis str. Liberty]|uniref:TrbC/VirB2 family protein n=1 Tax=Ehrlichia chaffeensis TaxID=945 RepID=UPI000444DD4B|nr:TrbC/VirB2 family protein [Ehrlichia chaffeensis]AHX05219.1 trbC/VIRB2 family protein [Ehrlichia chaffeensis str. Jax]AHX06208.1 trbC/VIRB2 family protein [Ehrlichia chaffeensis str. Liberty]